MKEEEDYWETQSKLPLRQRDDLWWAGVALPNALYAFVVVLFVATAVVAIVR
jgi:hypothetical protein